MAAALPGEVIDLTEDGDVKQAPPDSCGNPHHPATITSMRQQLLRCQRTEATLQQRLETKDATIANRQARIAELQARDVGRVAEITRLQTRVDTLEDRLSSRGKRQRRVSYLISSYNLSLTRPSVLCPLAHSRTFPRQSPYQVLRRTVC